MVVSLWVVTVMLPCFICTGATCIVRQESILDLRQVVAEFYWFGSDAVGRLFVDALSARARAGCVVRVVYDAIGSMPVDDDMFDDIHT